jgi:hypothetical protein
MEENDKSAWMGAALFAAVILAGIGIYRFAAAPPPSPAASAIPVAPAPAVGAPAPVLPKLEESDVFVRERAVALSADKTFAGWLKTDDLIARLTGAANLIAAGKIPGDALKFLAPRSKFSVVRRGGKIFMDPRGWARYDMFAAAVASVDAAAAARLFRDVKPLFQQAWNSLGENAGDVQEVFLRAAAEVTSAPALSGGEELKESKKGLIFVFADESLEKLSPARKQLLRMGPKNAAAIKAKLDEITRALAAP